jgi:hypothetical protein
LLQHKVARHVEWTGHRCAVFCHLSDVALSVTGMNRLDRTVCAAHRALSTRSCVPCRAINLSGLIGGRWVPACTNRLCSSLPNRP